MYDYPDIDEPGSVATYGNGPRNTPAPKEWRRGYMAEAKLASWPWRLASGAIDYVPLVVIADFFSTVHAAVLGFVIALAAGLANSVYMQGTTGQSLGKRIVGTRLVSAIETGPWTFAFVYPGIGRCFGRHVAHLLDWICYIGFIRPLWQRQHQTWADSIAKTVVLDRRSASEYDLSPREPGQKTTRNL